MKRPNVKGFFVTGTDTGVGKTYISRKLADSFSIWEKVTYMKPVQTGCFVDDNGMLTAPDFRHVISGKAVMTGTSDQHVPYRFEPACSPHLAARLEKQTISFDHIADCLSRISSNNMLTIVEGAGGIFAPLGETVFMIDLILHLQLPVVLVSPPHLGTLNHTFLTLRALRHAGAGLAGIVLNNCRNEPDDFIYRENIRMIRDHTRPVPFLEVQHGNPCNERIDEFCKELGKFL